MVQQRKLIFGKEPHLVDTVQTLIDAGQFLQCRGLLYSFDR